MISQEQSGLLLGRDLIEAVSGDRSARCCRCISTPRPDCPSGQ